ncbi:hypothetical protein B0A69_02735 [Chryseobacterium shigense]|uniref:NADPH:quinone reductase n=1 Tax=Chryseobacterium shigense TaxID=297244 RepID=A0A1N7I8I1_9FLAO|nr:NADP-dependent oxidoreductase [Chryseobacterium shigense]PQA96982.1 hypothetical protein B0A69_02735 [Chryseobacterium shigense]SIS33320.1 NADPH:quinone reductase [Chryseobacterium shigense]
MKVVDLKRFGAADNFSFIDIDVPSPSEHQVLIKVFAFSINPIDYLVRSGQAMKELYSELKPRIIGWDIAGVVESVGKAVKNFKEGDEVFGMINFPGVGKAYGEYVVAHQEHIALKPSNINFVDAAASTLAALTAYKALEILKVKKDDRVLIHGAAGGVGHFAVQIAKSRKAYVIGTASASNHSFVKDMGADEVLDYHVPQYLNVLKNVDKVLESIGGENIEKSLNTMNSDGLIVCLHSRPQDRIEARAKARRISGQSMVVNSDDKDILSIAKLLADGVIHPYVSKTYTIDEIIDAHINIESGKTIGKIVVTV